MIKVLLLFTIAAFLIGCHTNSSNWDCSSLQGHEQVIDYTIEYLDLGNSRYSKYILNEAKYSGKEIELVSMQNGDTLVVKYLRLGGNSNVACVTVNKDQQNLNITNHEFNYLKELTLREFKFKILNIENLKFGIIINKKIERK